uniref:Putative secreted protein n=1 Tax=Rhipicephalus microplus TaxID=6941 RepID=A0A6G5A0K5_RHIMP
MYYVLQLMPLCAVFVLCGSRRLQRMFQVFDIFISLSIKLHVASHYCWVSRFAWSSISLSNAATFFFKLRLYFCLFQRFWMLVLSSQRCNSLLSISAIPSSSGTILVAFLTLC